MSRIRIRLGESRVVAYGKSFDEIGWGAYQFPALRNVKGGIGISWSMSPDSADAYEGAAGTAVSADGGTSWHAPRKDQILYSDVRMQNGRYWVGIKPVNAQKADWLKAYSPDFETTWEWNALYYSERLRELDLTVTGEEYDPADGKIHSFPVRVNWPYMPTIANRENKLFPLAAIMMLGNGSCISIGGALYLCTYINGFDAETGKVPSDGRYNVYVFRSDDSARTWTLISQILTTPEYCTGGAGDEGFCEPMMEQMPDGSVVMLMRTGGGCPSYIARSTDGCRSWSRPVVFDRVGVFPQIMTLRCGVTLASYGRPRMYLRASDNPSGMNWGEPMDLGIEDNDSCFYTALYPIDDQTALLGYAHFRYPAPDGSPVKTILVRTVAVD